MSEFLVYPNKMSKSAMRPEKKRVHFRIKDLDANSDDDSDDDNDGEEIDS